VRVLLCSRIETTCILTPVMPALVGHGFARARGLKPAKSFYRAAKKAVWHGFARARGLKPRTQTKGVLCQFGHGFACAREVLQPNHFKTLKHRKMRSIVFNLLQATIQEQDSPHTQVKLLPNLNSSRIQNALRCN
jgi:hypothetical protein